MTTDRRRSRSLSTALSILLVAVLAGCDPSSAGTGADPDDGAAPPAEFVELDLPASTRPEQPVVDHASIVGPAGDLPWFVAGARTEPGDLSRLAIWLADGAELPAEPRLLPVAGDVRSVTVAAAGDTAVIGGTRWSEGEYGTYLLLSTDRSTWQPVESPELDAMSVEGIAVTDGDVVALGTDRSSDAVRGLRVAPDGGVTEFEIDAPEEATGVVAVAASGDDMVVLLTETAPAGDDLVTALRSRDAGETWSRRFVPGIEPQVVGVTSVEGGFVATGTTRRDVPAGEGTIATAWSTTGDDDRWSVSHTEDNDSKTASTGFGAPAPFQDGYAAVLWLQANRQAALSIDVEGRSGIVAATEKMAALSHSGPSAGVAGTGEVRSVLAAEHGATVVRLREKQESMEVVAVLAEPQRWQRPATPALAVDGGVPVSRAFFEILDDGWRRGAEFAHLGPADGELVVTVDDAERRVEASAPDGRRAALETRWLGKGDDLRVGVLAAASDGETWSDPEPVLAHGYASASDMEWVGGRWLATGVAGKGANFAERHRAALWTSKDGKSWRTVGKFEPGDGASSADHVCAAGDGAFVLGTAEGDDVVWARDGERWKREPLDLGPEETVGECRVDGAGSLVRFGTENGTELRYTEDGLTYETRHVTGPDEHLDEIVEVPGGLAATGSVETEEWSGPVLWLSQDGSTWWWSRVPSTQPDVSAVYPSGDGVVVAADGPGGMRAWRVSDTGGLIAAHQGDGASVS